MGHSRGGLLGSYTEPYADFDCPLFGTGGLGGG